MLTINKDFAEPRFPSFMGTRKAAKAIIPVWQISELDVTLKPEMVSNHYEMLPSQPLHLEMIQGTTPQEIVTTLITQLQAVGL